MTARVVRITLLLIAFSQFDGRAATRTSAALFRENPRSDRETGAVLHAAANMFLSLWRAAGEGIPQGLKPASVAFSIAKAEAALACPEAKTNGRRAMRAQMFQVMANPDLAVLIMVAGGLLICLEFNMPGRVLPGAIGTLCLLLGAFEISQSPLRHAAVALLIAALVMVVVETRFASRGALAATGTGCLVAGLATLVDSRIPETRVHLATAISVGIVFGAIAFSLARVARRARQNKVHGGQGLAFVVDAAGEPE